jgi:hypothetical protein
MNRLSLATTVLATLVGVTPALAASYTNISGIVVELPGGDISFADEAVSLSGGLVPDPDGISSLLLPGVLRFPPGTVVPLPLARNAGMALGPPDTTFSAAQSCAISFESGNPDWIPGCNSVSLGVGGSLTVKFTDNFLTGDGTPALDLWIFETGPDIEDTFVEISNDGSLWQPVGSVGGSTSGVDIDAFGFGPGQLFSFVRLTDDVNEGELDGATVGADIDAIAAISTIPVPLPGAVWLLLSGLGALFGGRAVRRDPEGRA